MEFAAREHRLEQVARIHRAFGLARAHDVVQLVDEEQDGALGRRDVLEHGLETFFEFAAELRARDERAHVERDDALVLERLGNVAAHDALRETLDDGRLADARLADEHRVVFRAPREHLHDAPDLVVAPDHGIEFALLRGLREVLPVPLQRLIRAFGILRRDALIAAHLAERAEHLVAREARVAQEFAGGPGILDERQQ